MNGKRIDKLIVVCDACCSVPNAHLPGRAGKGKAAYGILFMNGEKDIRNIIDKKGGFLGEMTVPEAEYNALISALNNASEYCRYDIEVWMDNELVIRHLTGVYRLKADNLKPLFDKVKTLENRYKSVKYFHHPRENIVAQEADKIAKQALKKSQVS